jgi:nucleoside-diphosphate-sugar epimerase
MRIAFIGGTVFIGHAAANRAVSRGHDVSVLHRGKHRSEVTGARSIRTDRADPHDLVRALREARPDVVVDTRSLTRPDAEVSALALEIVGAPVVVLSSQDVYAQFGRILGHPGPEPVERVNEDAPLTVPFPYRGIAEHEGGEDYDKKDVERVFIERDGLAGVTVLRLPATYGSRDPKRRFSEVVDALDRGERTLPEQGGATFRWTHAHALDVGHAIVLAAERIEAKSAVFNLGEATTPTMRERAEVIAGAMGVSFEWTQPDELPASFEMFGRFANDFVADTTRIRDVLGFSEITSEAERHADLIDGLRASRQRLN